ncbi:phage tail protein [Vibrio sp. St2]|uniref:phage tail protein n=1 Tax=Vibrio sp. St2 TaxID=2853441 RepID=UPI00248D6183|nr:phage tail protein [Vibrio sp. St2]
MSTLQAIPTQHGIDILNSEQKNTVTKYRLIGALTHDAPSESLYSFYENTIETSYYDDNGVLTFILNLPIEQHFDEYLHQIHVLDSSNQSVIECSTPKVALPKGIGGMVTLKAAISGEVGQVIFKHSEFVTGEELNDIYLPMLTPKGRNFSYNEPSMPSEGGWYTIIEGLTEYSNCPLMGVINTVGHRSVSFIVQRVNVHGSLQILQSQGSTKNASNCHLDGIRLADRATKLQVKLRDVSKPLIMNVSLVSTNPAFAVKETPTLETGNPDVNCWFSPLPTVGNDQSASVFTNLFVGDSTDNLFQVISSKELAGIPLPFPLGAVPSGWLECRGQSFNKSAYPKLAERYPSGVLSDLRAEFIRGHDNGRGIDVDRELLSLQLDAFQDHQHTYHTFRRTGNEEELLTPEKNFSVIPQTTTGAINGRTADETRPRNIAYMYIVRAA